MKFIVSIMLLVLTTSCSTQRTLPNKITVQPPRRTFRFSGAHRELVDVPGGKDYTFTLFVSPDGVATQMSYVSVIRASDHPSEGILLTRGTWIPNEGQPFTIELDGEKWDIIEAWQDLSRSDNRFRFERTE